MAKTDFTKVYSVWLFVLTLETSLKGSRSADTSAEVQRHLDLGRSLLSQGQFQEALTHFHAAVDGAPNNYLTYYTRATVYLALGKSKAALPDLNKVLSLKPDFTSARLQRGNVLLKMGSLEEAHIDFEMVLRKEPDNEEAVRQYHVIEPLRRDIETAHIYYDHEDYENAIHLLSSAIEACPWDSTLRDMRANSYIAVGDLVKAIGDVRSTTKLIPDNTVGILHLSALHYKLGEVEESLKDIRECLKLDPDHKDCFSHYKKVKKLAKLVQDMQDFTTEANYEECIRVAQKLISSEKSIPLILYQGHDKLCHCHLKHNEPDKSIENCKLALEIQQDARIWCDLAEALTSEELYDKAMEAYRKALELEESFQRAKDGMQTIQRLQKQSKRRDYYKILGVRRTAGKKEIMKAYRKLAHKWHPDNFQNENSEEKEKAEKKFIDIASAKEVLTDPEKRQKYDNGEDPLDPESQHGQGFNPFQQFHQFHGSPFQFKFQFN